MSQEEASLVFDFFNVHAHKRMVYTDFVTMMMSAPTEEVKTFTEKRQEEEMQKKKRTKKGKAIAESKSRAIVARIRTERRKREILRKPYMINSMLTTVEQFQKMSLFWR